MSKFKFQRVNSDNIHLLSNFIKNLGSSKNTFRYYNKREVNVISNHLVTCLFMKNEKPVCYGHLDKENDIVWLGIAVVEKEIGKGYGVKMMEWLMAEAKELKLHTIKLTVDNDNSIAIKLYEKHGFKLVNMTENTSQYQYDLKSNC